MQRRFDHRQPAHRCGRAIRVALLFPLFLCALSGADPPPASAAETRGPIQAELSRAPKDFAQFGQYLSDAFGDEPYAGALKGAQGVLESRSGNAVDKALLLEAMSGAVSPETRRRFAFCTLKGDALQRRVDAYFSSRYDLAPGIDAFAPSDFDAETGRVLATLASHWQTALGTGSELTGNSVRVFEKHGPNPIGFRHDALVAHMTEHVWLEIERSGSWTSLDPYEIGGSSKAAGCDRIVLGETLPERFYVRIDARVSIAAGQDATPPRKVVLKGSWRAVDLGADGISLDHVAQASDDGRDAARIRAAGRDTIGEWFRSAPPEKRSIKALGSLLERALSSDTSGAMGDREGSDQRAGDEHAEREWLEVDYLVDAANIRWRTEVLLADSRKERPPDDLVSTHHRATGVRPGVAVASLLIYRGRALPAVPQWPRSSSEARPDILGYFKPVQYAYFDIRRQHLQRIGKGLERLRIIGAVPEMTVLAGFPAGNDGLDWSLDVANANAVVDGKATEQQTWERLVASAVSSLSAEQFVTASLAEMIGASPSEKHRSSLEVLARNAQDPAAWFRASADTLEASQARGLPFAALTRIHADLAADRIVIAPLRSKEALPFTWWSVDLRSALVRDESETGLHSEIAEYSSQAQESARRVTAFRRLCSAILRSTRTTAAILGLVAATTGGGGAMGKAVVKYAVTVEKAEAAAEANRRKREIETAAKAGCKSG